MVRYRYEAVDAAGVPIHGVVEADSESDLNRQLSVRKLRLVSSAELSLDSLIGSQSHTLPRLQQLRIGEQLREAMLTGLPAHVVVRAVANEPLQHPLLSVAPLLHRALFAAFVALAFATKYLNMHPAVMVAAGFLTFVVSPIMRLGLLWLYRWRPQRLLQKLADRLESGQDLSAVVPLSVPAEIRHILKSNLSDEKKARVAADMAPSFSGGSLRTQQFVLMLIGPLVMLAVVVATLYLAALVVLPGFRKIFEDFGTDLPALTELVIEVGKTAQFFGITGWLVVTSGIAAGLGLLTMALANGRLTESLASVPLFGLAFRWAMQARVARLLAATIRNDCDYPEALQVATAASGFRRVRADGELLMEDLLAGRPVTMPRDLTGLPIGSLMAPAADPEKHRASIADSFQSLSHMLDTATIGQGRLLAVLLQFATLSLTGIAVGTVIIALFLPLIKLMNDLS